MHLVGAHPKPLQFDGRELPRRRDAKGAQKARQEVPWLAFGEPGNERADVALRGIETDREIDRR